MTKKLLALALVLGLGPLSAAWLIPVRLGQDWRTAPRHSAGIAPNPVDVSEAVIQVYAARAFNWRGLFAVHVWVAIKSVSADQYRVHQVLGWQQYRGLPVVVSQNDLPDRLWYGSAPQVLVDIRGGKAEKLIPQVESAVKSYPYPNNYKVWPGPNSNTFIAWIGRNVPDLNLKLPNTAVGKDFLGGGHLFALAPSGTGYQFSIFGVVGVLLAKTEGLEINLFGLSFGFDFLRPAIKFPGIGRIGMD